MRHLRRLLIPVLAIRLIVVVLLGGALAWVQWGSGAAALASLAGRFVPGLVIEGLAVTLPREVRAARITLADEGGVWLDVAAPRIGFDLHALWQREAHVQVLTAERISVSRLPAFEGGEVRDGPLLPSLPHLPLGVRIDRLAIAEIAVAEGLFGQGFRLSVEGRAALVAARLSGDLAITRLDAPGTARLALDLAPGADRLFARLDVAEPPGGVIAGVLGAPTEPAALKLRLDGPASAAALNAEARLGSTAEAALSGTIGADARGAGFARVAGHFVAAPLLPAPFAEALARLEFSLDATRDGAGIINLRSVTAKAPLGDISFAGRLDPEQEEATLAGSIALGASAMLAAYVPEEIGWQAVSARFRLDGKLLAPQVAVDAEMEGFSSSIAALGAALGATPRLELQARALTQIERLTLTGDGNELTAAGDIGERLDLRFGLRLADLAQIVPELAGALTAEGHVQGARDDPSITLQARGETITRGAEVLAAPSLDLKLETPRSRPRAEARLEANYAGLVLTLSLSGVPEGQALRINQLDAAFGTARLAASGLLDVQKPLFAGALSLAIPDLAPFSDLVGHKLTGSISLDAEGRDANGAQQVKVKLNAPDITLDGRALAAQLELAGGLDDARGNFAARHGEAELTGEAALSRNGEARLLTMEKLKFSSAADQVQLTAPAKIEMAPDGRISLAETTITNNRGGRLRLEGFWSAAEIALNASLAALPIAPFAALLSPEAKLAGVLTGEARVNGTPEEPRFDIKIESPAITSAMPAARGVPPLRLTASASGTAAGAEARAALNGGTTVRLAATARIAALSAEAPLSGSITGRLDIGSLVQPLLAAGAQRVSGMANLDIRLEGSLAAPRLGGQLGIANGSFRDLQHGVTLNEIAATIMAEDRRLNLARFAARTAGSGSVSGTGALDLGKPRLPFDLRLKADAARPVNADLGSATFDGELRLAGEALGESRLAGKLTVQRAELRIPDKLPPAIQSLPGVREVGQRPPGTPPLTSPTQRQAEATSLPPIMLDLAIAAPRAIFLRGRGLDAELGGEVKLGGKLDAPHLEGGFMLRRGTLAVLDRRLTLNRANITFDAGGLMPNLDVLATSRASDVDVNVAVEGPARDPKISFTSNPELPADEVLARLLFGRRGGELSPFQMLQLAEALSGATGRPLPGPGGLMERIRRTLALDRLSIGQEKEGEQRLGETPGATLETGRYVADGVFLGLKQSADGGPPRVGVQIDLMPRLRLEAESGGNSLAGDRVGIGFEYEY
ncbi:MAG: translocation/assembly module TamB domain-containing protein [Roseomonas sp.]|nr:translocation/assembly module TamB domain-containing protein [Roseomonas sp.]MCA3327674.1 translocation/assembly module TamB domain-containing protein [Roseomonas sp.]MCA3330683.1 translocation/assembly module TamB domain-containing protein [Roseomonas sp.]MCA3334172.1 translocation/assembly module TamB domain-containing protein [Roseomonas sp.]MCA3346714.1 translocation/assembly module TamB domain-containing protein [Roseomonas sp.]